MYPYFVANITISNVEKLKIMATVSSVPNKPYVGYTYISYPSVPYLLRMYLCPVWVCTPFNCHTHFYATCYHLYLGFSVDATMCTPIPLGEIYGHVLPCTPIISLETYVNALTKYSVHVVPTNALTQSSVHVLLRSSLLLLPRVYVSVHRITRK